MPAAQTPPRSPVVHRFRRTLVGGLGVVLPPLLTIVILVWVWNTVKFYVLEPVTGIAGNVIRWSIADVRTELPNAQPTPEDTTVFESEGKLFKRLDGGEFTPLDVYVAVRQVEGTAAAALPGQTLYDRYVHIRYLQPHIVVPVFLCVFVLLLYLLGILFAAGLGRVMWSLFEQGIGRLPLVRGVYGSVKQVTDFMLNDKELEFTRVVAIQYPRDGVWALAFVTGEGLPEIRTLAGEPIVSVLVSSSPWTLAGYTMMLPKSDIIDLDLSVEQACQFIISGGVVVPRKLDSRQSRGGERPFELVPGQKRN